MNDLAAQSLDLVNRELANTLEEARREIESHVEGHSGQEALLRAAELLHLASGALKIVDVPGAALLAEEMEHTCRALVDVKDQEAMDRGLDALTRSMVQLPAYVERLLGGARDVPLLLLPLLNDLRRVRGKPLLSEGTLLLLGGGPAQSIGATMRSAVLSQGESREFQRAALKLRPAFQAALLGWIRGERAEHHLGELLKVAEALRRAAGTEAVQQLWQVLGGVLVAVQQNALEASVAVKRLVGQADRQLKRLIDGGEVLFANSPPVDLLNNLLYYIARAQCADPRVQAIRETYGLGEAVPAERQLEEAREVLAGPSVKLMRTVAQAIKEDLASVKDVLDIFVRTGMSDVDQLKPQLDMLKKIGDTLGVLGLEKPRDRIQEQTRELGAMVSEERVSDEAALERVAAALLEVEDALDRELVRAVMPAQSDPQQEESESQAQYRHVTQAVMGECIVNLAKVKEAVTELVDHPENVRVLDQVAPQLKGITAGLLMLNKTKAVRVVERIGAVIASRLGPGASALRPELLERLADAIVSVEYYMETVSAGRSDPWYMLDNAARCLDLLERVPAAARRPEAHPLPPAKPPVPRREPAVMEVEQDRSDPELVELFIEEAKEEVAAIERHLPSWIENPEDTEALIAVRRSFHTLKGSGRMVGAQLIGEYAWSVENLLNRIINQTLQPTSAMLEFIRECAAALPALVEQLEAGTPPRVDVHLLMKRAEAFAGGDPNAQSLTSASLRAVALSEPAPADESAPEAAPQMDPVLAEIFVKEMRGHLDVIRGYLDEAERGVQPHAVDEPLYRACHTLHGSANMAGFEPAIRVAAPLSEHMRWHYDAGSGLGREALSALADAVATLESMAEALAGGLRYDEDLGPLIERLEALAPATPTPPAAEPEEEKISATASFDPEIAAIFAEEASEILENAETALQSYRSGGESEALTELQRLLHTLKGGARMAGVLPMGNLSHALESLVSGLSDGRVTAQDEALALVQRSLDTLHHMRDAIDSGRPLEGASDLIRDVEAISSGARQEIRREEEAQTSDVDEQAAERDLPREASGEAVDLPSEASFEPTESATEAARPASPWAFAEDEELSGTTVLPPFDIEPVASASVPGDDITGILELSAQDIAELEAIDGPHRAESKAADAHPSPAQAIDEAPDSRVPAAQPPAPSAGIERAETARVDAALLDALLNGAGEISIFQSRLNQQIHSIEFHLGELGQTVTRLREQLRKLEAETEAQILHRHQEETGGREDFDPLELDRYSTIQQLSRALAETANDVASINELLRGLTQETDTLLTQQGRATAELQDGLMQTRMVPFQRHVSRLARIVRQAAADTGKQAELHVQGAASELDRQVLECMLPPFEHLLRNAVVHGIEAPHLRRQAGKSETGRVTLRLKREGSEVLIEVEDDGAGLDLAAIRRKAIEHGLLDGQRDISDDEAIELILKPGFSTAGQLTQTAGRGVGMDVVDNEVKKLGGSMRVETTRGEGTRFVIRLPYTLAITQALIVDVGEETFALPLPTVEGITRLPREQLLELLTQDDPKLDYGGVSYRIQHLGTFVGAPPSALPEEDSAVALVLVRAGENSTALLTDALEGSREIVVKTLGPHLTSVPGVSGATILGDGRIIVILDAPTLVRQQRREGLPAAAAPKAEQQLTALVVDDSITMRRVTERLLERRGMRVLTARDGLDAITVLQEHVPDIILLDIEMPRMDGYQFATHVRNDAKVKDVPIIMITSRSGEKHRARAIEIGVNDYLSKPYQEGQLVSAIEGLLGRSL